MLNNLASSSKYINASSNDVYQGNFHPTANAKFVGDLMYDHNTNQIKVFDGSCWVTLETSTGYVGMSYEAEEALEWAIKKRQQEEEWYKLATTNEAVRIALDQLEQAKAKLELITILSKDHEKTTS